MVAKVLSKMIPLLTHSFQLIELWETFLLRLDAGEDGLPYYVPESETGQAPVSESTTSAAEPAAATEDEDEA